MWNWYGVWSNLASSGEPAPLLHMTTLTTENDDELQRHFIFCIKPSVKSSIGRKPSRMLRLIRKMKLPLIEYLRKLIFKLSKIKRR